MWTASILLALLVGGRDADVDRELKELAQDAKATVLLFLATECPMCNGYVDELRALAKEYGPRGVRVVGLYPNGSDGAEKVASHAREYSLQFPTQSDTGARIAHALGAKVTPEAIVLDSALQVRYRGRIDDAYASRLKRKATVSARDLRAGLDDVLAGKEVTAPETEAFGCAIDLGSSRATKESDAKVTFCRDVMPILQRHCQPCHRPGEVAPFSLMNYEQTAKWAADIQSAVEERVMPPWKAVAGFGEFSNERRLQEEEIATISEWVEAGMPEGDAKDLPPAREFPVGWQRGEPDLVLEMSEEFAIPASGNDVFRYFVLPTGLDQETYVKAVEVRPGNRRVVHHAVTFLDTSGRARERDDEDPGPGYTSAGPGFLPAGGLGGWAPGTQVRELPAGIGYYVPAHADLVMQLHYHPSGKPEKDKTKIGLYFAKEKIENRFIVIPVAAPIRRIEAGNAHFETHGSFTAPFAATALSVFPHMHLLGKEFTMKLTTKDGVETPLISIKDWDWNWQEAYVYAQPVPIPAGAKIELAAVFDNSEQNPRNPNRPPKDVSWGEQTGDEMCLGFLGLTLDDPTTLQKFFRGRRRQ